MKSNEYNLTQGTILNKLLLVALPIMGTQFMQMAYNLTDMFWLGRLGSDAVAASGTAGMYLWLSMAFAMFGRVGAEIGVSQNLGRGDKILAQSYAQTSLTLAAALGVAYTAVMMIFNRPLIGFFGISETQVVADARLYLLIVAAGIAPAFVTSALTGAFNGSGNTPIPFYINGAGLIINMVLDPVMIFTLRMGIAGAAIATVLAQIVVCVCMLVAIKRAKSRPFERFRLFSKPAVDECAQIFKWGLPVALESLLFTFLSMLISRMVAVYGASAIAVQRIGSQIESLSWLICGGYSSALTAFVGQNYGAGKWTRIHKGFRLSIGAMLTWGVLVTALLYFAARPLFMAFLPQPEIVGMGIAYLHILAVCQAPACVEFTTAGCFRGMGRTLPPSIVSVAMNASRVVLAYFLCRTQLGLDGIWWAVSIGAACRGIWLFTWYLFADRRLPKLDAEPA